MRGPDYPWIPALEPTPSTPKPLTQALLQGRERGESEEEDKPPPPGDAPEPEDRYQRLIERISGRKVPESDNAATEDEVVDRILPPGEDEEVLMKWEPLKKKLPVEEGNREGDERKVRKARRVLSASHKPVPPLPPARWKKARSALEKEAEASEMEQETPRPESQETPDAAGTEPKTVSVVDQLQAVNEEFRDYIKRQALVLLESMEQIGRVTEKEKSLAERKAEQLVLEDEAQQLRLQIAEEESKAAQLRRQLQEERALEAEENVADEEKGEKEKNPGQSSDLGLD
jgi:hypothetical protein